MGCNRFAVLPNAIVLYDGGGSLISDREGHIRDGEHGLYFRSTRFLNRFDLRLNGHPPRFVSANAVAPAASIAYYTAPTPAGAKAGPKPDQPGSGGEIAERAIAVQVSTFLGGGLHQTIEVTNHGMAPAEIVVSLGFHADFADLAEA